MPDASGHEAPSAAPRLPAGLRVRIGELVPTVADRVDRDGFYPAENFRALGQEGLFGRHLAAHADGGRIDVGAAILATAEVARHCMASGFCTWCQNAAGWYLEQSDNETLRRRLQPGIASGQTLGGTGLSNPMKAFSGIEGFRLRGQRVDGGWIVSGVLPWVSNLGDGHWFGTVFQDADNAAHRIMAMIQCGQPGVKIRPGARFIALEGTGTYPVMFSKAFIADDQILCDPAEAMIRRIKPGFILLQTGMGLGVIRGAIDLMHEGNGTHAASNRYLPRQAEDFEQASQTLTQTILRLAATPLEAAPDYMRAVLQARLSVSELCLEAAQAALLHMGSRAYLEGSPANRRLRESYFVAIVTPSIRHLRQELAALAAH